MYSDKKAFEIIAIDNRIDWITCTVSSEKRRLSLAEQCFQWSNDEVEKGNKLQEWKSFGYHGYDVGGIRWGRRAQDDLVTLKGDQACDKWLKVAAVASTCSRIDLATTIRTRYHNVNLAAECYKTIQEIATDLPIIRNYSIITSLLGGDTLYVGKRASREFGRLYDKSLQSNDPHWANCWRYEVEIKKPLAWEVLSRLIAAESVGDFISSYVHKWFSDRLIEPAWNPTILMNAIEIRREKTHDERALDWLARSVAPTVARLVERGKAEMVLKALGIYVKEFK